MLSICTQTAISVLHDIASGNDLQSGNFLLSEGEWKGMFDKLEKGRLIRLPAGQGARQTLFVCPLASTAGNIIA